MNKLNEISEYKLSLLSIKDKINKKLNNDIDKTKVKSKFMKKKSKKPPKFNIESTPGSTEDEEKDAYKENTSNITNLDPSKRICDIIHKRLKKKSQLKIKDGVPLY